MKENTMPLKPIRPNRNIFNLGAGISLIELQAKCKIFDVGGGVDFQLIDKYSHLSQFEGWELLFQEGKKYSAKIRFHPTLYTGLWIGFWTDPIWRITISLLELALYLEIGTTLWSKKEA